MLHLSGQAAALALILNLALAPQAALAAPAGKAPDPVPTDCKAQGARLDPSDPGAMILPVPVSYVGKAPARPETYKRKVPLRLGPWVLAYCDAADALAVIYEPAADALALYRTCTAGMTLYPVNMRITGLIDGMEAGAIKSLGLSGVVRSRTQDGMVGGQPATYYRISGQRVLAGLPALQESQLSFGTVRTHASNPVGIEPVAWTITINTDTTKGPSCLAAHTAITDHARAFPLGNGEAPVKDPGPPRVLSNLKLP